jgi:hypothetical protein
VVEIFLRWIGFAVGVIGGGLVVWSAAGAALGMGRPMLLRALERALGGLAAASGRRIRSPSRRSRLMAARGPLVATGFVLTVWTGALVAMGLILLPWDDPTPAAAMRAAAAAVLGLGLVPVGALPAGLAAAGALIGLLLLALGVVFLVRLLAMVGRGRRVTAVVEAKAGLPPWGPALAASYARAGAADRLSDLYRRTEAWAAELAIGDPLPLWFRTAGPQIDGITALVAVMDCAALDAVVRPDRDQSDARLLLDTGTDTLEAIRRAVGVGSSPVRTAMVTEEGFAGGMVHMQEAGFVTTACPSDVWERFVRLRRAYAPAAVGIARRMLSPPAPWMGEWPGSQARRP